MTSNIIRVREYLQAVAAMGSFEKIAVFYTPDVVIREFPNKMALQGRVRGTADLRAAYEHGRHILQSQTYRIQRILEAADQVAIELEWSGVLAVPVMNWPAGSEMKACVAMFLTFRDGKIAS